MPPDVITFYGLAIIFIFFPAKYLFFQVIVRNFSIQNILVILDCFLLAAFFYIPEWFDTLFNSQKASVNIVSGFVIALAALANLASVGSTIVMEKDWIVFVAMDDPERLASMNAVFRTLDLTTLVRNP